MQTRRARTNRTRSRANNPRPSLLIKLPLDVLIEVASYLSVLDILHLSLLCKALRSVLLSRSSSRTIWRSALREIGGPDCPTGINEPQLVRLVFDESCYECGDGGVREVDYGFRIRLCASCTSSKLVQGRKLIKKTRSDASYEALQLCYFEGASELRDYERWRITREDFAQRKFFVPEFQTMLRRYSSLLPRSASRTKFMQESKKRLDDICHFARAIEDWLRKLACEINVSKGRAPIDILKIHLRKTSILEKLERLGYCDDDFTDCEAEEQWKNEWNEILIQPYELTERIWLKIWPRLEAMLIASRQSRPGGLGDVLCDIWNDFQTEWAEENPTAGCIAFEHFRQLPEVQSVIKDIGLRSFLTPSETATIEASLVNAFRVFEKQLKDECIPVLAVARQRAGLPSVIADGSRTSGDNIVFHPSSFFLDEGIHFPDPFLPDFGDIAERYSDSYPEWTPLRPICPKAIKIATALFQDLDVSNDVTMAMMGGRRFSCRRCRLQHFAHDKLVYWHGLVRHFLCELNWFEKMTENLASDPSIEQIPIVDGHNTNLPGGLAAMQPNHENLEGYLSYQTYPCKLCLKVTRSSASELTAKGSREYIESHMRVSHGIEDPTLV